MNAQNILQYIDKVILNLKKHINSETEIPNSKEKEKMELRLEIVQEIKRAFDWGLAEEDNKQSHRIFQLAKFREEGIDITSQLKEIILYSKIKEVIPYIQAVSYRINNEQKHLTEELLLFCQKQLEIIDASPYKRGLRRSMAVFPLQAGSG